MTHELKKDLLRYFEETEYRNREEENLYKRLKDDSEYFDITSVSRNDLETLDYDPKLITDDEMERIADKMGDAYCDQCYWEQLDIIAESVCGTKNRDEE